MNKWINSLFIDPIPFLEQCPNPALLYQVQRDLLEKDPGPVEKLWELPAAKILLNRQKPDGSWAYPKKFSDLRDRKGYDLLETYETLAVLVEKYCFNKDHGAIKKARDYIYTSQTSKGDFRGIYGNQYSTTYTAGFTELLIKAGYGSDNEIAKVFRWFLKSRQNDGGWAVPLRTHKVKYKEVVQGETLETDPVKPSSHLATGMVLRAFAASDKHSRDPVAFEAGRFLASRLLKKDSYVDRRTEDYWFHTSFPFRFTDIVSALDSLYKLGFPADDPGVAQSIRAITKKQDRNGFFSFHYLKDKEEVKYWVTFATCRVLKYFLG
jgi:hypothetical protein